MKTARRRIEELGGEIAFITFDGDSQIGISVRWPDGKREAVRVINGDASQAFEKLLNSYPSPGLTGVRASPAHEGR